MTLTFNLFTWNQLGIKTRRAFTHFYSQRFDWIHFWIVIKRHLNLIFCVPFFVLSAATILFSFESSAEPLASLGWPAFEWCAKSGFNDFNLLVTVLEYSAYIRMINLFCCERGYARNIFGVVMLHKYWSPFGSSNSNCPSNKLIKRYR